jgi:hypothetical protein
MATASALLLGQSLAMAGEPIAIDDLSDDDRQQVRCTALAGALAMEAERGASERQNNLTMERVQIMGDQLHSTLAENYGADEAQTQALIKAEYEALTFGAVQNGPVWADQQKQSCAELWGAAEPPGPSYNGEPVDAAFCNTVWTMFAEAMAQMPGDSARIAPIFQARADRIRAQMIAEEGGDAKAEALVDAVLAISDSNLVPEEWEALPEVEAEAIMGWCEGLAGPDG